MKLWTTQSHTTGRERKRRSNDLRRADKAAELRRLNQPGRDEHRRAAHLERVRETIWLDKFPNHTKTVLKDNVGRLGKLYDDNRQMQIEIGAEPWPERGNAQ